MGKRTSPAAADPDDGSKVASSTTSDSSRERRRSARNRGGAQEASNGVCDEGTTKAEVEPEDSGTPSRRKTRQTSKELNKRVDTDNKDEEKQVDDGNREGDPSDEPKHHHRKHHHHEHHLNEETLKRIKGYLRSDKMNETLDEDAIAVKILRTDRATSERVRFLHDPYADSDLDEGEAPKQSYQAAEDYTLALDFYKRAVTETQEENPDKVLDKRTLYWLRKALGLHRRNDLWETTGHEQDQTDESGDDAGGSQGKNRRTVTRGMVRSTRIKRRQERSTKETMNLNALVSAVEELEDELGPFVDVPPPPPTQKKPTKQNSHHREKDSSDEGSIENRPSKQKSSRSKRPLEDLNGLFDKDLLARLPDRRKEVTKSGRPVRRVNLTERFVKVRVVVAGKDVKDKTNVIRTKFKAAMGKKRKRSKSPPPVIQKERRPLEPATSPKRRQKDTAPCDTDMAFELDNGTKENGHISLGLLEWKRRQQEEPAEIPYEASAVQSRLARAGLSADLPLWDVVNFIPALQRQPISAEPPRRRHSDQQYAEWISKLIDCLSGSGRNWALHEFFYSDIDRAWFNFDQFQVDVARLGVPPTALLTRKEWSLVRRSLRKSPRRFSRAFIKSELAKLCQYRDIVRAIQRSETPIPAFGFDVPRYIRVGATVTAIHWKRRLIHRGIVLGHDPHRNGYLVQFERQELGFQFCPDYEVASHGVPDILLQASDTNLEGANVGAFSDRHARIGDLSYGTSYGPMYVDQMDPVRRDKKDKIALLDATLGNTPNPIAVQFHEPSPMEHFPNTNTMVEKVAERETLVELVATIEKALARKSLILDAIDKCNRDVASLTEKHGRPDFIKVMQPSSYMAHYSWLQANLRVTNQTLESSLLLLQVMYGELYTGLPREDIADKKEHSLEDTLRRLCEEEVVNPHLVAPWSFCMAQASDHVGSLVAHVANGATRENDSSSEQAMLRAEYLNHSLSAAARVLLNANYFGALVQSEDAHLSGDSGRGLSLSVAPMKACLQRELQSFAQRPMPSSIGTEPKSDKLHRADAMRGAAMKELQDAMASYEAELAAAHVSKKILRS